MKTLNFANLKLGDKFRILNEGWSKETFIYNDSLMSEKTRRADRLVFPRVGGGSISIPGAVKWKLQLEKIEE